MKRPSKTRKSQATAARNVNTDEFKRDAVHRATKEQQRLTSIRQEHHASKGTSGSPRLHKELEEKGSGLAAIVWYALCGSMRLVITLLPGESRDVDLFWDVSPTCGGSPVLSAKSQLASNELREAGEGNPIPGWDKQAVDGVTFTLNQNRTTALEKQLRAAPPGRQWLPGDLCSSK